MDRSPTPGSKGFTGDVPERPLQGRFSHPIKSALAGCTTVAGLPLHDGLQPQRGCIGFGSVNRAKGLDHLAVVLIDFPPWPCPDEGDLVAVFMGASRARQMLAVVATRE